MHLSSPNVPNTFALF